MIAARLILERRGSVTLAQTNKQTKKKSFGRTFVASVIADAFETQKTLGGARAVLPPLPPITSSLLCPPHQQVATNAVTTVPTYLPT